MKYGDRIRIIYLGPSYGRVGRFIEAPATGGFMLHLDGDDKPKLWSYRTSFETIGGNVLNDNEAVIDEVNDLIANPNHYTSHPSGVEPISITAHETFLRGNIIKYVLRAPFKGTELQDLRKARQYLDWEIERVEGVAA